MRRKTTQLSEKQKSIWTMNWLRQGQQLGFLNKHKGNHDASLSEKHTIISDKKPNAQWEWDKQ